MTETYYQLPAVMLVPNRPGRAPNPPSGEEDLERWAAEANDSFSDLARWAQQIHSAIFDSYIPQTDRIENMIMVGTGTAERPAPIGSRRLYYDLATRILYLDVRDGDTEAWEVVFSSEGAIVVLDTSNFGKVLSASDGNLQDAMDTIDDHVHEAEEITLDVSGFGGILGALDDEVQHALDTLDDLQHSELPDAGTYDHGDIDNHIDDGTIHFLESSIAHGNIQDVGFYTHYEIDEHIDDATIHFLEGDISHLNIQDIGSYAHADIDSHLDDLGNFHDHGNLTGLADDDHPQYPNKTGWDSPATSLVTMAFNDGTREFTITPTGASFDYWIQGVKYTKTTPQTVTITDTYGAWFIYFDGATLTASQTPWGIVADDKAFVALIYWDADASEAIRVEYELHGWQMDASTHEYLHDTFGTRWESGLAVGINGDNLDVTAGEIHDEDLQITITDSGGGGFWEQDLTPASLPILYRSGASGLWKRVAASTTPCYLDTNVLQVNVYSGGSWAWSPVTVNQYCAYWVVASSDINEPVFLVPGQEDGATLSAAQDGNSLADMAFGSLPSAEHKVVARVIVRRVVASPYYDLIEVADYRNVSDEPSGTAAIIGDHGALTGLNDADHPATAITVSTTNFAGILSGADTLVQTALDTIDDHDHDAAYSAIGHTHTESDITDLGAYLEQTDTDALYSALGHTHLEADITDLGSYLPLSAESSYPLTGTLYVQPFADPAIRILPSGGSITYFDISASPTTPWEGAGQLFYESPSGFNASLLFDVYPADGTSDAAAYFFATGTTTTGSVRLGIGLGDGTYDLQHIFRGDNGDVILGNQTVGTFTYGGTNVSLEGHTHFEADITDLGSYLPLGGGTLTGDLSRDSGGAYAATLGVDRLSIGASGTIGRVYRGGSWIELGYIPSGGATYDALRVVPGAVPQYISNATPYNLALADDLDDYLPLTAGSGEALTGDLYIDAAADPAVYLREAASTTSFSEIRDRSDTNMWIRKTVAAASAYMMLDPYPSDGTSEAHVWTHRLTNTTGTREFIIYKGDGTATEQHTFNAGTGDVALCKQGGDLTVGGGVARSDIVLPLGHVDLPNGYAVRGANVAGSHVFLIHAESGTYRVVVGNSGARLKLLSNDAVLSKVPASALSDANHDASSYSTWVDEVNHRLYFKVKYSDGTTVKSGYISLS